MIRINLIYVTYLIYMIFKIIKNITKILKIVFSLNKLHYTFNKYYYIYRLSILNNFITERNVTEARMMTNKIWKEFILSVFWNDKQQNALHQSKYVHYYLQSELKSS